MTERTTMLHRLGQPTDSRLAAACLVIALAGGLSGCVRRRMSVRTSPAGATVSVDNQVIGTSPAASSFLYYGTREIRIEKDGFRTETIRRRFDPPWYQFPGIDFIAETLWPGEIRDERIVDVELVPRTMESTPTILSRADQLRAQSKAGMIPAPAR